MLLWIKILLSGTLLSLARTTPSTHCGTRSNHCGAPCKGSVEIINCGHQPALRMFPVTIEEPPIHSTLLADKVQQHDRYTGKTYGYETFAPPSVESTPTFQRAFDTTIEESIKPSTAHSRGLSEPKKPSMQIRIEAVNDGSYSRTLGALPVSIHEPVLPAVELRDEKQPKLLEGLSATIDKIVCNDCATSNTVVPACSIQARGLTNAYESSRGSCSYAT